MHENPILVLDTADGLNKLKIEYLTEDATEKELNGESSYHIYHVRMITELLLQELSASEDFIDFSCKDISLIATASSTHDVGKCKISKRILEQQGTLSPVEYDIIKKHSAFGEEMLRAADCTEVDEKTAEYAAQIARYHHERIDGTGYPDGLRGEEIPVWAQAVSIADVYDALTSSRSYKQAFSQDVALQMISSGMCGAFDERLVACLMRVINYQSLRSFKEKMERMRRVVEDSSVLSLKRVLLVGNTEYLDEDFVKKTFPESKVMVVGSSDLSGTKKPKLFRTKKPSVEAVLKTYEFDLIVFFSAGLSYRTDDQNDAEELRKVLKLARKLQEHTKILYLSQLDAAFEHKTDRTILAQSNEKLCEFYSEKYLLDVKIVRIPYLYSGSCKKDFLYQAFARLCEDKKVIIPEDADSNMYFLSLKDLSELIVRIVDNWKKGGILTVGNEFRLTFGDLGESFSKLEEKVKIEFSEETCSETLQTVNTALRNEYGWYAKVSIVADLREQYEQFLAARQNKSRMEKLKDWIAAHSLLVKSFELILMFVLSEILVRMTHSAVIFSIIDFRTIFVVIMATLYGSGFGITSAFLASVSYFISRMETGTNALTIFYEPTNWLAFILFFLVGGLCGYVKLKKDDYCRTLEEKTDLLEDKLSFTQELYEDTLQDKKELKRQIISSKDSFGKIFDITRKLNTIAPQQLYLKIIETFEEILENKSIAVYSIKSDSPFGRLAVASRDLNGVAARSIDLNVYAPVIEKFKDGGLWKNIDLNSDYPMYAAGIYRGDSLMLMIFLWHADIDQQSLYYMNLFKILRDLAQMSLLRAYDYNVALYEKQYIPGTHIMNAQYFEECIENFSALSERKVSAYVMLEIDYEGLTLEEADAVLSSKIRSTDILGITSEGKLCLLLSQATEEDLRFVLPRFEGIGVTLTPLNKKGEL